MRSRPDIKLYLSPAELTPGAHLQAEAVLRSRSETPIDGIVVRLTGLEQRQSGMVMVGNAPLPQYQTYRHVDLVARVPKALLTPGEHRFTFAFDIPPNAPPQYRSRTTSIVYDLDVRVGIPWWPDRSAHYLVPVVASPLSAVGAGAAFCTDARGPQGTALYLEASLESPVVPLGGVLRGALSLANVAHHRIRRIELALVHTEHARDGSGRDAEMQRYVVTLQEGAPADGQALPFRMTLPANAPTSFGGALIEVRWYLEIRAVITLGSDVVLALPFKVIRVPVGAPADAASLVGVPPVGRDRQALLWAESARRNCLAHDAAAGRMTLHLGAATLAVTLEPRKGGGSALTAVVAWPRLGIELAVAERRWVDAWSGGCVTVDVSAIADRFTVRGREAAQVRAFLDEASCHRLLCFDEVAIGDEGALLVSSGTAQTVEELDAFVSRAVETTRALVEAALRVPPPAVMAPYIPAWRAFAARLGGRLLVGEVAIHDAVFDEAPLAITTEWSKEGAPAATRVRFPLHPREGASNDEPPPRLDAPAQALLESVGLTPAALTLHARAVEARLPAPIADPATLEPILAGLGQLARRLSGDTARGPYR